ncbi:MAG: sigma-70 family RNA polymerase sigma factor [Pseudomonadota bacterium]
MSTDVLIVDRSGLDPAEVFRDHSPAVYRLALSLAGHPADAEDITQEVFLAVLKALPGFRGEARLSTWIYAIALRVATRWLARRPRTGPERAPDPGVKTELPIDLLNALRRLPLNARMVIALVAVQGLRHDEAAQVLGIPAGTVGSRLSNARRLLREYLSA